MKTIFITAYQGFISRNILNTDVLKILRTRHDFRIVIFVPADKKEYIEQYYGGDNVVVEGVDFIKEINANKFWYRLGFILENTRYVRDQRADHFWKHRNFYGYLNYAWLSCWAFLLSNLRLAHSVYRFFDYHISPRNAFRAFFQKYQPNLIFSTDIFGETDVLLIRGAKSSNIPVVGMVRSWDNPTTKGILRIIPEKIIVHSPTVKKELIELHGCDKDSIFLAGLPQFDSWLSGPTQSREEFFSQIGADPSKRLIMFAPAGSVLSDTDWQLCQILKESLADSSLPSDLQFLVRNHPQHPADLSKFQNNPNFIIENPGSGMRSEDYKSANLTPTEDDHLRNSVYYSEIVTYVVTSLGLDSSIFNKPQILVNFDGFESKPYIQSVRRYHREDCLANLVACGGTKVAHNKIEWLKYINDYLKNPQLDQAGRDKTVAEHLYKIDGKAGERIANCVLNFLTHGSHQY